jgi:hypothetical protein
MSGITFPSLCASVVDRLARRLPQPSVSVKGDLQISMTEQRPKALATDWAVAFLTPPGRVLQYPA